MSKAEIYDISLIPVRSFFIYPWMTLKKQNYIFTTLCQVIIQVIYCSVAHIVIFNLLRIL